MNTAPRAPVSPCLPDGNFAGHLERLARTQGWWDRTAYLVGRESFTFADVHEGAARAAGAFAARGVGVGSRVWLALPEGISFIWAFLGALRLGAVVLPVGHLTGPGRMRAAALAAPPALAVCDEPLGLPPVAEMPASELTARQAAPVPWEKLPAQARAFECYDVDRADTPCLYAHRHSDTFVFDQATRVAVGLGPTDVCLNLSPPTTAFGLGNTVLLPLLRGSATVLHDRAAPGEDVLSSVQRHGATVLMGPPSAYDRILGEEGAGRRTPLDSLRKAVIGAEIPSYALGRRLLHRFGSRLLHVFATPETGHAVWAHRTDSLPTCSRGQVLAPYRLRVVGPDGKDTPVGTQGQLQVSGTTVGPGTARREGDEPFTQGQWTPTAYAATKDEDGSVWIHERPHRPAAVPLPVPDRLERLLAEHPAVRETTAHLTRSAREPRLRAYVSLHDTAADTERLELIRLALLTRAHRVLGPAHVPEDIVFVHDPARPADAVHLGASRRDLADAMRQTA
ncbi:AMP-binding protein [Streptomyces sp. NPDC056656]|uniref:AMP-binding protein n=1 Tax=Streptomyces sp. NPDC056656 TaxID=3345895 RepID=UPI0036AA5613